MTTFNDSIDPRLRDALNVTAEAEQESGASPEVTERLWAAVRARRAARDHRRQLAWLAAAAAVVIGVTAVRWETARTPAATPRQVATPSRPADAAPADFLPLRYANVPTNNGQIVPIVVPTSALASFGLESTDAHVDAVHADVFVGEDGLARAIRFSPLTTKEFVQ